MSTAPETPHAEPEETADDLLKTLSGLGAPSGGAMQAANNLTHFVRAANRHVQRLVHARRVRLWITRRGGRRLEGREFPDADGPPIVQRVPRGEGLAGWCVEHGQPLRISPGEARPDLRGELPEFESALVLPVFRRGEAFGAIECLDHIGGSGFAVGDLDQLELSSDHIYI
jgi:hypothetical protein